MCFLHNGIHLPHIANFSFLSAFDANKLTTRHLLNEIYSHALVSHDTNIDEYFLWKALLLNWTEERNLKLM